MACKQHGGFILAVIALLLVPKLHGVEGQGKKNELDVQVIYGPLKTKQATSTADYEDYTSTAECPPGTLVLGCQSITTNCDFDGAAYRQEPTKCVTWNSMTFWGVSCPESTVQAVAFCGKASGGLPKVHYDLFEDETSCIHHPGSQLVGCACAIVYGHDVACAGAIPSGQNCTASPDSPEVNTGSICMEGITDSKILEIKLSKGVGSRKCPAGYLMTDCMCSGKGCLKKTIENGTCKVEVDADAGFQGANIICVSTQTPGTQ